MNAIKFIQQNGVDAARMVIGCAEMGDVETPNIDDLKRLVESVDMLKRFGGIELSKEWILEYSSFPYRVELKQAIADYESIYGGEHV
ncbi:hypothetical protein [Acinetobacter junii]|uniref:Uncharacterized protein n=1 Tax=Acinetobacter junii TaxID=40215 RepID=A0AAW5RFE1_ACIJU|nr:hypothetical protein [Acinetobacter junii]MCU4397806.1 hypothetical protein [Acinetobacter junii]